VRTLYAPPEKDTVYDRDSGITQEYISKIGGKEVLDSEALVLYFPAPKTVTGEDILELHVHGGPATVKAVLSAIPKCSTSGSAHSIRYAEAGEFTKRAFMNNRMDLTQVEALGDVLAANTEQQRRLSVRGTTGTLAKQYEAWRTKLLYARGELEALIDFSEDQHFDESPAFLARSVAKQVEDLANRIEAHISNAVRGELLRNGISIALLGAPNAGKSSLLNRIVGREAAIVSREAGTTRDVVEVGIDLGGYLCRVGDMAGLRTNNTQGGEAGLIGIVEEEGIKRAKARALESDVVICVFHIEQISPTDSKVAIDEEVLQTASQCLEKGIKLLIVINKTDLLTTSITQNVAAIHSTFKNTLLANQPTFFISCHDSQSGGIDVLLKAMTQTFADMTSALSPEGDVSDTSVWHESLGASERHRLLLQESLHHLEKFLAEVPAGGDVEAASRAEDLYVLAAADGEGEGEDIDVVLAAESLRAAADCLARITGRGVAGDVEEVLGVVFEK
jgi:tRNA modification GTPase